MTDNEEKPHPSLFSLGNKTCVALGSDHFCLLYYTNESDASRPPVAVCLAGYPVLELTYCHRPS